MVHPSRSTTDEQLRLFDVATGAYWETDFAGVTRFLPQSTTVRSGWRC